jgi:hypothetical protein
MTPGTETPPPGACADPCACHDSTCVPRWWAERNEDLAWQTAYLSGWSVGRDHGWNEHGELTDWANGLTRAVLHQPTHHELARRRQYSDEPCRRPGCAGCSRCTRAAEVATCVRRYGQPDFPGLAALTADGTPTADVLAQLAASYAHPNGEAA